MTRLPQNRPIDRLDYQLLGTKFRWTIQRAALYEMLRSNTGYTRVELVERLKGKMSRRGVYYAIAVFNSLGLIEELVGRRYRQIPRIGASLVVACPVCGNRSIRHDEQLAAAAKRHFARYTALPAIWHIEAAQPCGLCRQERQIQ